MASNNDIGYYTLPVILSMEGVEKQVNSKLSKAFGDVGKKAGKALSDGTEADVKKATDAYAKLRDKASDALGKVRVEEEKLAKARAGGKTDQIVAAEERLNKARRDSESANRSALSSYKDLESAQGRIGTKSRGLSFDLGGLGSAAGAAGSAMATAGVIAGGAALAGLAALGGGVIVLGRELYDLGKSWDDTMDGIAIKTGFIGPELDKLKQSVKDLAPNTAASIGDIGNVVGSVKQALHLTGMDLDVMSKRIVDLNRMTETTTNVRDLGKAFRGFGVDAKDQVSALDSLYEVSTKTGIPVNDLIKTMVDGGSKVRGFGMSFSETAAFIASFEEAGVSGEKVIAGLGKAAINLAKDGKGGAAGLREAMGEIQRLLATGQSDLARTRAADLFGAKAYAEIFDAMQRGAIDAENLGAALQGTGLTIADMAAATDDWDQTWQKLKNTISVALEPVASGVFNLVNEQLSGLSEWVTQNQDRVIGFFGDVADWAFESAKSVVAFGADAVRMFASLLRAVSTTLAGAAAAAEKIPGMGGLAKDLGLAAAGLSDLPFQLEDMANAFESKAIPALQRGQDYVSAFMSRTQEAAKFTQLLGDTIATVNNGGIQLSDNTPEVADRLKKIGIEITTLPDGTFGVKADNTEAQKVLDAYIEQATGQPLDIKLGADDSAARKTLTALFGQFSTLNIGANPLAGALPGAAPSSNTGGSGVPFTLPAGANAADLKAFDDALLAQIPTNGRYDSQAKDLGRGLADCSSSVEDLVNILDGKSTVGGTLTTANAHEWLTSRGFVRGTQAGAFNVGFTNAGVPHMEATLPGGTNFNYGNNTDAGRGGRTNSAGAFSAGLTERYYRPVTGLPAGAPIPGAGAAAAASAAAAPASAPRINGVTDEVSRIKQIADQFGLTFTSGRRDEPGSYHHSGQAGDFSNGSGNTAEQLAFANHMADNFGSQIAELIYSDPRFGRNIKNGSPFNYDAATLAGHQNHVHIAFKPGAFEITGQPAAAVGSPATVAPLGASLSSSIDTSRLYGAGPLGSPTRTQGFNLDGEAGYYETDPKRIREANQRVAAAQESIIAADAAAAQARARLEELPIDAEQSAILGATESVRAAEVRAATARQEAADAATDFAETAKGDFKKSNDTKKDKSGGKGLGELGSIASNFLTETFGLPDLSNFMPLQMMNTVLGAFDWSTMGMSDEAQAAKAAAQGGTSSAPFGIPDIAAPPMPTNGQHGAAGGGAPGPSIINVDQSQNFNNSPLGWDPAKTEKERNNNINRAPRLPVGMGS